MEIITSQVQAVPQVTIVKLKGALDGSSYEDFIRAGEKFYDSGVRNLILDMSELTFLSSAGLSAIHRIARVFRGEDRSTFEEGWAAIHAMGKESRSGYQKYIKLLNPTERILDVLDTVGFKSFFEIYTDTQAALDSFQ
jgi:anti-anti-sigma factor